MKKQFVVCKIYGSLFFLVGLSFFSKAQINTNNALTPQQLVQQVLLGTGVVASNITLDRKSVV